MCRITKRLTPHIWITTNLPQMLLGSGEIIHSRWRRCVPLVPTLRPRISPAHCHVHLNSLISQSKFICFCISSMYDEISLVSHGSDTVAIRLVSIFWDIGAFHKLIFSYGMCLLRGYYMYLTVKAIPRSFLEMEIGLGYIEKSTLHVNCYKNIHWHLPTQCFSPVTEILTENRLTV